VHDRLWIPLLATSAVPPLTLEEWAQDASPLRREAAARIAHDPALLAGLAGDLSRQVRRAVASNREASVERARLAIEDPAIEVRARAAGQLSPNTEADRDGSRVIETARFAAALRAMASGGVLAPDVVRALGGSASALDLEGAMIAGRVLPRSELVALVDQVIDLGFDSARSTGLAAGLALRPKVPHDVEESEEEAELRFGRWERAPQRLRQLSGPIPRDLTDREPFARPMPRARGSRCARDGRCARSPPLAPSPPPQIDPRAWPAAPPVAPRCGR